MGDDKTSKKRSQIFRTHLAGQQGLDPFIGQCFGCGPFHEFFDIIFNRHALPPLKVAVAVVCLAAHGVIHQVLFYQLPSNLYGVHIHNLETV